MKKSEEAPKGQRFTARVNSWLGQRGPISVAAMAVFFTVVVLWTVFYAALLPGIQYLNAETVREIERRNEAMWFKCAEMETQLLVLKDSIGQLNSYGVWIGDYQITDAARSGKESAIPIFGERVKASLLRVTEAYVKLEIFVDTCIGLSVDATRDDLTHISDCG